MRISDWSSDVCSSDLHERVVDGFFDEGPRWAGADLALVEGEHGEALEALVEVRVIGVHDVGEEHVGRLAPELERHRVQVLRSEEHTSELQSLMRISYAVFCLKKKKDYTTIT